MFVQFSSLKQIKKCKICKFKSYWPINLFAFLTESLLKVSFQLGKNVISSGAQKWG